LQATVSDTAIFRAVLQCLTHFIKVAHFRIRKDILEIRSVDPHGFCYADIVFYPVFFKNYVTGKDWDFCIEASRLVNVVPTLIADEIRIRTYEGSIQFSTEASWRSSFEIKWLQPEPGAIPKPNTFKYESVANLPAKEFASIIQKASTISREISFITSEPDQLVISASKRDYSFRAEPISPDFQVVVKKAVTTSMPIDYLRSLRFFINMCDSAKINVGNEKPLKIDVSYQNKMLSSFSFSYRRKEQVQST